MGVKLEIVGVTRKFTLPVNVRLGGIERYSCWL